MESKHKWRLAFDRMKVIIFLEIGVQIENMMQDDTRFVSRIKIKDHPFGFHFLSKI